MKNLTYEPFSTLTRPTDLEKYVIQEVADITYLMYEKKTGIVQCTRCGKTGKADEVSRYTHNGTERCPYCRANATTISKNYGRKSKAEYGRILWFEAYGRVTYGQLDEYIIDYSGDEPKVLFRPAAKYKLSRDEQECYRKEQETYWRPNGIWVEMKRIKIPTLSSGLGSWQEPRYQKTVTYHPSITKIGKDLQYANIDDGWIQDDPYTLIAYMSNYLKHISIEVLLKSGFEDIAKYRINGNTCRWIRWNEKDLRKIFRMNWKEIRILRCVENKIGVIERFRMLKKIDPSITLEDAIKTPLSEMGNYTFQRYEEVAEHVNILKMSEYIRKQRERQREQKGQIEIIDYCDYIKICEKLGMDMKRKSVLFPKEFEKAHEETSKRLNAESNRIAQKEFEEAVRELYPHDEYREADLFIRAAKSIEELNNESKELCHCVWTYAEKVREHKCVILFIRRTSEPDKPYFTVELSQIGEIVQCRGQRNCRYPKEVEDFLERWKTEMKKQIKEAA